MLTTKRLSGLVLAIATGLVASEALAATGWINPTPPHVVVPLGTLGSGTLCWGTSGASTAEVWVSTNSGAESLFARSPGACQTATWLQAPSRYVFRLYEGTAHTTMLSWTSITTQRPPDSIFGFNYWPAAGASGSDTLESPLWDSLVASKTVQADLDHMASLGAGIIRLNFWDWQSGIANPPCTALSNESVWSNQISNLGEMLTLISERGMKAIIAFHANCQLWGLPSEAIRWMNGFIDEAERAWSSTVIAYDYYNEWPTSIATAGSYLRQVYDGTHVPMGKRAVSITAPRDKVASVAATLKTELEGRRLDYIDIHRYESDGNCLGEGIRLVQEAFPHSTVLVGECGTNAAEDAQRDWWVTGTRPFLNKVLTGTDLDCGSGAAASFPKPASFLNWYFVSPGLNNPGHTWEVSAHDPKHVLGSFADAYGLIDNADFELGAVQWSYGSNSPASFVAGGPSTSDAASNQYYGRVQVIGQPAPTGLWLSSYMFPVAQGRRLFVNAFVRANLSNVNIKVSEYDSSLALVRDTTSPMFNPVGWSWNNVLRRIGTWSVVPGSGTSYAIVTVAGQALGTATANYYLDVDAVSAWQLP